MLKAPVAVSSRLCYIILNNINSSRLFSIVVISKVEISATLYNFKFVKFVVKLPSSRCFPLQNQR